MKTLATMKMLFFEKLGVSVVCVGAPYSNARKEMAHHLYRMTLEAKDITKDEITEAFKWIETYLGM